MLVHFLSSHEDARSWRVLLSYLNDTLLQHPAALAEAAAAAALEGAGEDGAALQGLMAAQAAHRQRMLLEHVPLQVRVPNITGRMHQKQARLCEPLLLPV
jgi:hypothetical protein